ncbi:MAG: xanthine dehydrogenase accessory factor [Desulforhopalus sp.]
MTNSTYNDIRSTKILIRGAGDLASGIAHRLCRSGFRVCLIDTDTPMAVRRMVSFSEAIYDGEKTIEGITAVHISQPEEILPVWEKGQIPLLIDPANKTRHFLKPHVLIDAIIAKRNLGTDKGDAPLVIGMGPGFNAGTDVHVVIETNRGHNLGKLIFEGPAERNTGVPGTIGGFNIERVLRAPCAGIFKSQKDIGDQVAKGEQIAQVSGVPILSKIGGIIRGMLRDNTPVTNGMKVGDVDPRGDIRLCPTISDKARSLGGAAIEAILSQLPELLPAQ